MRIIFYLVSGIFSTLIAWNLSQILILDIPFFLGLKALPFRPDFILLPFISTFVAVAMVVTEIFISNPTRHQANWRNLYPYLKGAIKSGLGIGFGTACLTALLYLTGINAGFIRVVSWSLVGLLTGLSEGLSWRSRSIEGSTNKGKARLRNSTLLGFFAGATAAIMIETIRQPMQLGGYEDPVGFTFFGFSLGLCLSCASAPTYQVALRAGEGFETVDPKTRIQLRRLEKSEQNISPVLISGKVSSDFIEKRQVIKLLSNSKIDKESPLTIGSGDNSDIILPNMPEKVAEIIKENNFFKIHFFSKKFARIEGMDLKPLQNSDYYLPLKHNNVIIFEKQNDSNQCYRFLFYDRNLVQPKLNNLDCLRFVTEDETWSFIEEGLSIQLPSKIDTKHPLVIGSGNNDDIYLPNIPKKAAKIIKENGRFKLRCLVNESVEIQGKKLSKRDKSQLLLHNNILTFFHENNSDKYYRFVFYDRFLDPEA